MDIHRRSSVATDATAYSLKYPSQPQPQQQEYHPQQQQQQQQPMFIPSSSLESNHSLAMSAPANMGYDYNNNSVYPTATTSTGLQMENNGSNSSIPGSAGNSTSMARSFEEDYTVQMK